MFGLTLLTPPAAEPLTRADAKRFARCTHDDEDVLFDLWIKAARQACEQIAGLALITQTWRLTAPSWDDLLDDYGRVRMPLPPLQAVHVPGSPPTTGVAYLDADSDLDTIDADDYLVETGHQPGLLMLAPDVAFPAVAGGRPDAVQITFVAGYGSTPDSVPADVRDMLLSYVSYRYHSREEPDAELLESMFAKFRVDDHC